MSYLLLFLSAFGAATLLPLQSEAVLMTFLVQGLSNPFYLILVATIGNVFGSCVNWWLGLKIEHFKDKKWFPVSEQRLLQAQQIYHKYGFYSLLLSWTPVIGDPIKENFWRFLLIVTIAKGGRYLTLYALYLGLF